VVQGQDSWILLRLADGGKPSVGVLTNGTIGASSTRDARLEFNRYGSAYFLTAVWSPFSVSGRQVPPTSREKNLAKRGVPVQTAAVRASTSSNQ
jgi:hypothetical protein